MDTMNLAPGPHFEENERRAADALMLDALRAFYNPDIDYIQRKACYFDLVLASLNVLEVNGQHDTIENVNNLQNGLQFSVADWRAAERQTFSSIMPRNRRVKSPKSIGELIQMLRVGDYHYEIDE